MLNLATRYPRWAMQRIVSVNEGLRRVIATLCNVRTNNNKVRNELIQYGPVQWVGLSVIIVIIVIHFICVLKQP